MKLTYNFLVMTLKKYSSWCLNKCIVVNPMKSNYLKFNTFVITIEFDGHVLENPGYVKYLGIILDDKSFWQQYKAYVLERC